MRLPLLPVDTSRLLEALWRRRHTWRTLHELLRVWLHELLLLLLSSEGCLLLLCHLRVPLLLLHSLLPLLLRVPTSVLVLLVTGVRLRLLELHIHHLELSVNVLDLIFPDDARIIDGLVHELLLTAGLVVLVVWALVVELGALALNELPTVGLLPRLII